MTARKIIGVTAALVCLAFAPSAWSHTATVTGTSSCNEDQGVFEIVWTLTNEQPGQAMRVTGTSDPGVIAVGTVVDESGSVSGSTTSPGYTTQASFGVTVVWLEDGRTGGAEATIDLEGDCRKPPPPPPYCERHPNADRCNHEPPPPCAGDCSPPDDHFCVDHPDRCGELPQTGEVHWWENRYLVGALGLMAAAGLIGSGIYLRRSS